MYDDFLREFSDILSRKLRTSNFFIDMPRANEFFYNNTLVPEKENKENITRLAIMSFANNKCILHLYGQSILNAINTYFQNYLRKSNILTDQEFFSANLEGSKTTFKFNDSKLKATYRVKRFYGIKNPTIGEKLFIPLFCLTYNLSTNPSEISFDIQLSSDYKSLSDNECADFSNKLTSFFQTIMILNFHPNFIDGKNEILNFDMLINFASSSEFRKIIREKYEEVIKPPQQSLSFNYTSLPKLEPTIELSNLNNRVNQSIVELEEKRGKEQKYKNYIKAIKVHRSELIKDINENLDKGKSLHTIGSYHQLKRLNTLLDGDLSEPKIIEFSNQSCKTPWWKTAFIVSLTATLITVGVITVIASHGAVLPFLPLIKPVGSAVLGGSIVGLGAVSTFPFIFKNHGEKQVDYICETARLSIAAR